MLGWTPFCQTQEPSVHSMLSGINTLCEDGDASGIWLFANMLLACFIEPGVRQAQLLHPCSADRQGD